MMFRMSSVVILIGVCISAALAGDKPGAAPDDVLAAARSYEDGGGYEWRDTGVPEEIRHQDVIILGRSDKGTYCCGFTFAVGMKVAQAAGLLNDKTPQQVKRMQREWYGSVKETAEKQMSDAMKNIGIGGPIDAKEARSGDFLQFWRTNGSGHSVIFLDWVVENGKPIGFTYRSSQKATNGIGDHTEYFDGHREGKVDLKRMYFARFNASESVAQK
jgi:hypothetical protein